MWGFEPSSWCIKKLVIKNGEYKEVKPKERQSGKQGILLAEFCFTHTITPRIFAQILTSRMWDLLQTLTEHQPD